MEDLDILETKPILLLNEISSSESPNIDLQQNSSSELLLSERADKSEKSDSLNEDFSEPPDNCSKRQLKRFKRIQNRLKMKPEWKLQRKLKKKARKTENKFAALGLEKPKITSMCDSSRKFNVVIDFSYDELMSSKDLIKCSNQVIRCYSANRRSSNPMQLHFCNFSGKIETELAKHNAYKNWDIHFHGDSYLDVFNMSDLVYLTSESRNVLETLEENKVYIIGGLVDHNAHKGVSYQKAVHEGISHAQLPIKKYIQMKSRSVLTINHVFEILLKVSNGESWTETLLSVVPPRFYEASVSQDEIANYVVETSDNEEQADDPSMDVTENTYETTTSLETTENIISTE